MRVNFLHFYSPFQKKFSNFFFSISLKLITGSLDQVDQNATITWVQPRVLSREQIGGLSKRLAEWVDKLNQVEQRIAPEVLAQGA
jgi:26S proteasome regulatory subunit N9